VLHAAACLLALSAAGRGDAPQAIEAARTSRIALLSPLDLELEPLLEHATITEERMVAGQVHHLGRLAGHDVVLVRCGRSLVASAATTQVVLDHYLVSAILVSGIAGGIDPGRDIGDVVVPERWAQYQEHVVARGSLGGFDPGLRQRGATFEGFGAFFSRPQRLTFRRGDEEIDEMRFWFDVGSDLLGAARWAAVSTDLERCSRDGQCAPGTPRMVVGGHGVSGNGFVDNVEYREWIWRTFEAKAVDQETAAIAQVAYMNDVPFIAFRGLSDLAGGRDGPNRVLELGSLAAGNAARALMTLLESWPQAGVEDE
jgi:adenosylhomocysteine nucleosidase